MRGKNHLDCTNMSVPLPQPGLIPPLYIFFSVVHVRQRCRSSPSAFKIRDERGEESHLLRADEPPWVRRPEQAEDCERRRPIVSRACRLEDDDEETLIISNQTLRLKSVQCVHQGGELASHKKSAFTFNQDHASRLSFFFFAEKQNALKFKFINYKFINFKL